jgi:hypothetical protein
MSQSPGNTENARIEKVLMNNGMNCCKLVCMKIFRTNK